MTKHNPRVTLAQIEEAAEKVEALCAGKTFEAFSEDWVAVMALERLFLIIGEAVKRLPEDLCGDIPGFHGERLRAPVTAWRMATTKSKV